MTKDFPALEVTDIHKSFGELEVLKGISLTAHYGDVISIIGSSGSGKSTFLRCLNLLERPTKGAISVAGEPMKLKREKDGQLGAADKKQITRLRSEIGFVFQSFNLWSHMDLMENIIEGPVQVKGISRKEAIEKAEGLLQKVGLYERKGHFPAQLSGGQQQRAAIARALAMEPELLLFDEPTSALDPELVGEVLKVMQMLAEEGRTMLVVTHEMGFAREVSSHVMYLHQGQVEEFGPPQEVFENPKSERMKQFISTEL
ncbi:ATP-binding cassette domain-containing protein [Terasakiella sp. SH-1]|uniref:ABC transporter ATP-binding protein n=1 Tax=Terasakiella sp. SH-1 TaxID=2560057 RepID=UPI001073A3BE|nr:ATP-binding cassette domain-containing protein [Terasakiella sp. SH-1]